MSERSIHNILHESFPKSNKEDWLRVASLEIDEENPLEKLTWKIDSLNFYPYYDQSDVKNLEYLKKFDAEPHHLSQSKAGGWKNLPKITVTNERTANEYALACLTAGADGILFEIKNSLDIDLAALLQNIRWPYCTISFLVSGDEKIAIKIADYIKQQNYDASDIDGSLLWEGLPPNSENSIRILSPLKKFSSLGLYIPSSSSVVNEISESLLQGVSLMDHLTNMGIEKQIAFEKISLAIACDSNFLMTIAKLKSLRLLWYQLSRAFEVENYRHADLSLHAISKKWTVEKFQPHGNMIHNAIDAVGSVLGGCNSLSLTAEEDDHAIMGRVALNVSNILREESHLDKVADKVSGAYAIENMVDALSREAWKDFQNKVGS